ncbi:hypothetical protein KYN89_03140 [Alteriqipengyuania sp. NZ-12B]|uniref:Uncharacterized protein n=1 Tax=Alteriqipengyuania abyssalis TaxID=2860200 RepID=A0ABS7PAE1_9SPHN|nr:hypothetical protein [Alteriqipengyuania abyssalis]MBY8336032.1 hypothetical protein [Alteriqipengyuania abyssalis]
MRVGLHAVGLLALAIAGAGLTGCGQEPVSSEAQDRADAEAVAAVLAKQTPPPVELALQPITYDDIVENSAMEGAGCSFYPGGEEDPFAILANGVGFVKYEGSIQRLAADAGTGEGPFGTREQYDGREYSLNITIDQAKKEGESEASWAAPATLAMADGYDREVAMSEGRIACGG